MTTQDKLADKCFCDRMYPDSNPNASCGDCPTRDYAPQPAPAHVQVDVLSELADEIEEAYPNADASNLRAFAAAHPPAPAADGAIAASVILPQQILTLLATYELAAIEHGRHDNAKSARTTDKAGAELRSAIAALRQPVTDGAGELPPLPQATCLGFRNPCGITQLPDMGIYGYTSDQMRAYARAAIASQQESRND